MATAMHIRARLIPWDDPAFVKAFEDARDELHRGGDDPDAGRAGERVQRLLRDAGFPCARVVVIQTVDEKLEHTSHWRVDRDG